jgi:Mn2+/Fe2+ NRAMP family transporter
VRRWRAAGPGAVVAAAFIGPGTVTTATLAGAEHGVLLLWALLFSVLGTLVLQEMAARLGLVTGAGLGEAVAGRFVRPIARAVAVGLVVSAIAIGNAAFEAGNLAGGALGAEAIFGRGVRGSAVVLGALAFALLWTGRYRWVERALTGLVALMAVTFASTALLVAPPLAELASGLLTPRLPGGRDLLLVLGLIGTTVVPYNLFLHATAVGQRWTGPEDLPAARLDAAFSILLGGAVSMAIVVTAAGAARGAVIRDAADMAVQLEPLLGGWARLFFAIGLLAAGLSSAVTAPLAAAYAVTGSLGWDGRMGGGRARAIWLGVLGTGMAFAAAGFRPVPLILFAQIANGILLPAVAIFLLVAVNDRARMGRWVNGRSMNVAGLTVVLVTVALAVRTLLRLL